MSQEELCDVFGRYGAIRQIRRGIAPDTKGSAFIVYEYIYDAETAVDHLKGLCRGRLLVVPYFMKER
jgi:pre-mRNA branch site protein p14